MAKEQPPAKPAREKLDPPAVSPVDDDFGDDVSQWLEKANEAELSQRRQDPDTRRFHLEGKSSSPPVPSDAPAGDAEKEEQTASSRRAARKPPANKTSSKDSIDAAVDGLRRMFGRK